VRTGMVVAGVFGLGLGAMVEIAGVFYANDVLMHNVYGFVGGILIILGIIVLGTGRTRKHPIGE